MTIPDLLKTIREHPSEREAARILIQTIEKAHSKIEEWKTNLRIDDEDGCEYTPLEALNIVLWIEEAIKDGLGQKEYS